MKRRLVTALVALVLVACSKGPPPPNIPADGKIHVMEKKGQFVITPTTLFCQVLSSADGRLNEFGIEGMGIDGTQLRTALKGIKQPDYLGGSGRHRNVNPQHCPDDGKNIILAGAATLNTAGKPYALVLSARQGSVSAPTAVVRVAVAPADGWRPDTQPEMVMGEEDRVGSWSIGPASDGRKLREKNATRLSLSADANELSQFTVISIFSN